MVRAAQRTSGEVRHLAVFLILYYILLFLVVAFSIITIALFLFPVSIVVVDHVGLWISASGQPFNNRYLQSLLCYSEETMPRTETFSFGHTESPR